METFIVRVWVPVEGAEGEVTDMHGFVNHVGSGRSHPFRGMEELLALLRSGTATRARHREEGGA